MWRGSVPGRKASRVAGLAAVCLLSLGAASPAPVEIIGGWSRATPPGAEEGVVYLSLRAASDDTLTGLASPAAGMAMLHATTRHGDMSSMTEQDRLALPAGQTVTLAPHGLHIMLMGLKHGLAAGDSVQLDLTFAHAGTQHVSVPVLPLGAAPPSPPSGAAPNAAPNAAPSGAPSGAAP